MSAEPPPGADMSPEEVLRPWLDHKPGCGLNYPKTVGRCDCGLEAALASLVPAVPSECQNPECRNGLVPATGRGSDGYEACPDCGPAVPSEGLTEALTEEIDRWCASRNGEWAGESLASHLAAFVADRLAASSRRGF